MTGHLYPSHEKAARDIHRLVVTGRLHLVSKCILGLLLDDHLSPDELMAISNRAREMQKEKRVLPFEQPADDISKLPKPHQPKRS
jgi:hypothetical protein